MPVLCEFINILVPIAKIDAVYPGGFPAFRKENELMFQIRLWHDDYLCHDGAMNPIDAEESVRHWESLGLKAIRTKKGEKQWADLCVIGQKSFPCPWLRYDEEMGCASHVDDTSLEIIGPGNICVGLKSI